MKKLLEARNYYKPFEYPEAYSFYERSEKMHWIADEVPMHQDVLDWNTKLLVEDQDHLTHILRFFTQQDVDLAGAYAEKYIPYFKKHEIRMMLLSFAARETVHIKAYSHLIDTLGIPEITYKQFHEYEEMKAKHDFVETFMETGDDKKLQQIAVFSALTEGMQLFSSFVMLLNYPRHNLMNGMGQIISWSIKDESLHCEGMTWLFRQLVKEYRHLWTDEVKGQIYTAATTSIMLEDKFIDLSYAGHDVMKDLKKDDLKQYMRYIADRRLIGLGMKGIFKVKKNPLPWVEEILNLPEHTNFFEQKPTNYTKAALTGSWDDVWV